MVAFSRLRRFSEIPALVYWCGEKMSPKRAAIRSSLLTVLEAMLATCAPEVVKSLAGGSLPF